METTNTPAVTSIEIQVLNRSTGEVSTFPTIDNALRTLVGVSPEGARFNQVLVDTPSRRKFKEAIYLFDKNGYELVKSGPTANEVVTAVLEKSIEKEAATKVKTVVKPSHVEVKHDDVFDLMARALESRMQLPTPQVDFTEQFNNLKSDLSNEINKAVEAGLANRTHEIVVTRPEGEKVNVGTQHALFPLLLSFIAARVNSILVGPAGSGKTSAANAAATGLGLPFYSISVGMQTTKTDFFGYMDATGRYVQTLFRKAFEHGGVFLVDEVDAGNANVITSINQALANGYCAFPDGMITKHADFVVIASGNTFGTGANREYVGRTQLDAATLDRFAFIEWGYDEVLENALCSNKEWLKFVRKCRANADKHKVRTVISPRASIMGASLLAQGVDIAAVKSALIFKGLNETEKNKLVEGTEAGK